MPGGGRQMPLECPLQVRLIGKARVLGSLGDRLPLAQVRPSQLHTLIEQVTVRRQAEALAKGTDQVGTRQAAGRGNVLQR